jgi:hypothetical protein
MQFACLHFFHFTRMGRVSRRKAALKRLHDEVEENRERAMIRYFLNLDDEFEDMMEQAVLVEYMELNEKRYLFRPSKYQKKNVNPSRRAYEMIHTNLLSDEEFLSHFRLSKTTFIELHHRLYNGSDDCLIKGRGSSELHLLVFLKYVGSNGNAASMSKMGKVFGISKGCFRNYVIRVMERILEHKDSTIFWPTEEEKREISRRICAGHRFQNCVGFIDGTMLPLESKPLQHGEDYYCRKGFYALNVQLV